MPLHSPGLRSKFRCNCFFTRPSPTEPTMNVQLIRRAIWFAPVVIGLSLAQETLADESELRDSKVFVGYVFRRPEKINFGLYTHLCHAFIVADEDGAIRPNRSCPGRELVADAHQANVRVLVSLGGW